MDYVAHRVSSSISSGEEANILGLNQIGLVQRIHRLVDRSSAFHRAQMNDHIPCYRFKARPTR